ncbi:unnamed protein product, partial [Phaeothamnion confervicola]
TVAAAATEEAAVRAAAGMNGHSEGQGMPGVAHGAPAMPPPDSASVMEELRRQRDAVLALCARCDGLFEWQDGPLVTAMQRGDFLLLDELSLAEDAVLERLNSVLEPGRSLTLAEKGGEADGGAGGSAGDAGVGGPIRAAPGFRIFATMNPGGDFGKRELSPALRSRFTEIWVPAVADRDDTRAVLLQALMAR